MQYASLVFSWGGWTPLSVDVQWTSGWATSNVGNGVF